jgi:hypothetical protein
MQKQPVANSDSKLMNVFGYAISSANDEIELPAR